MAEAQAEEVASEEKTPVVEKVEEKKEAPKEAPKTYSQEEVDRITAKVKKNAKHAGKKEAEAYFRGRDSVRPQQQQQPKVEEEKEPVRGDFESYEEYLEARAEYRAGKKADERIEKRERETKELTAAEERHKKFQSFHKATKEKFPAIEELIAEAGDLPMYSLVQDAIAESPFGPEIFHELLTKEGEIERLAAMSAAAAVREIGKLEARLEAKTPKADPSKETPKEQPKQASKAPAPITPPGGDLGGSDDMPSDKDSTEEWMRKENARMAKLKQ